MALTNSSIAISEHIHFASLSRSRPVTRDGCVRFANSDSETNRLLVHSGTPDGPLTVERCALACFGANFRMAGVENGVSCCTCFTCIFDELSLN